MEISVFLRGYAVSNSCSRGYSGGTYARADAAVHRTSCTVFVRAPYSVALVLCPTVFMSVLDPTFFYAVYRSVVGRIYLMFSPDVVLTSTYGNMQEKGALGVSYGPFGMVRRSSHLEPLRHNSFLTLTLTVPVCSPFQKTSTSCWI